MSGIGLTDVRDAVVREDIPPQIKCPNYGQKTLIIHAEIQTRFAPELELEGRCPCHLSWNNSSNPGCVLWSRTPLTTCGHVDSASQKTSLNFWAERMLFSVLLTSKS